MKPRAEQLKDGAEIGVQYRTFEIREDDVDADARTVALSFSSEEPVERWYGVEVLDHGKGSARMERLNNGAALLWNHNPDDQRGVVDKAFIDADKRGKAVVRYSRSAAGKELFDDVRDGIKTSISFGYRIHEVKEEKRDDGPPLFRVLDWEPYEISHVSIPADASVGVGRAGDGETKNVVHVIAGQDATRTCKPDQKTMDSENEGATDAPQKNETRDAAPAVFVPDAEIRRQERERERKRQSGIRSLGQKFGFETEAEKAIESGEELEAFRRSVTESWEAPSTKIAPESLNRDVGMSRADQREFSILKAIRDITKGGLKGLEREVSEQTARNLGVSLNANEFYIPAEMGKRDLEAGTDTEGGFTVATDLGSLIEKLDASMVTTSQLNVTRLTGLRGDVALPKLTAGATASWVDEEGTISDTAQTFGQVALSPKRLAVRTLYSLQLVDQSSVSMENVVRDDLLLREGLALDLAAIDGTGSGNQPTGLTAAVTSNTITFGGAPTWADYVDMWGAIAIDNADLSNLAYVSSATSMSKALQTDKSITTSSPVGQYLAMGNADGSGWNVMGVPYVMFNQTLTVANQVLYGNWSELIVASWGSRRITVDPYSNAATGQIAVTVNAFHDVGVRHQESFCKSTDSGAQ